VRTSTYEVTQGTGTSATYTYDANGNLATKVEGGSTWAYEWNAENRLVRVLKDTVEVASFAYDAAGRRVEKKTVDVTTAYTYDRQNILREARSDGTIYEYMHGPGVDEVLAHASPTAHTYYHADALGSVTRTTDAAGSVDGARQFDVWGHLEAGGATPSFAYAGREWDSETNLYYYRARYYDPAVGRFLSEDPLQGLSRLTATNAYSYVTNDPVGWRDPTGLIKWQCDVGLVTAAKPTSVITIGVIIASCSSGCVDGSSLWQRIIGVGIGAGFSFPIPISPYDWIKLAVSAVYAPFVLEDPFSTAHEWSLPGVWVYGSFGFAWPAFMSVSILSLGKATSKLDLDWEFGFDFGVTGLVGLAIEMGEERESCDCQ